MRKLPEGATLDQIKQAIRKHKERGKWIINETRILESHFTKMQEYYMEWESDMLTIQREIEKAKDKYGIPETEIEEFDALSDLLGE